MGNDNLQLLLSLLHDNNKTLNRIATRLDNHIEQTTARIEALEINLANEKKRPSAWSTYFIMSLEGLTN